jgi:hypothetical protein
LEGFHWLEAVVHLEAAGEEAHSADAAEALLGAAVGEVK